MVRNAIVLAIAAGPRLSEICRLAWADVNAALRTMTVRKAKGRHPRVIPLSVGALAALADQRELSGKLHYVFPARQTFPGGWRFVDRPCSANAMLDRLKPVQAQFPEFRQLEGKRVGRGFHLFRHQFASQLAAADVNLKKIQEWMGHTDIHMTERYIRLQKRYDPDIEKVF